MKLPFTARLPRLWQQLMLSCVGVVCCCSGAWGGCHYSDGPRQFVFQAPTEGHFVENGLWTHGKVRRVYEDGQFRYFAVPGNEVPCNGPHCGAPKSDNSLTTTSRGAIPRLADCVPLSEEIIYLQRSTAGRKLAAELVPPCPSLDGILRPPRS